MSNKLIELLQPFYSNTGVERVGFIIGSNTIVEVPNDASDPENGFAVSPENIDIYVEGKGATASWHTHPGKDSNLSGEDFRMFKAYRDMKHYIIGNDGTRCYQYDAERGTVMEIETDE